MLTVFHHYLQTYIITLKPYAVIQLCIGQFYFQGGNHMFDNPRYTTRGVTEKYPLSCKYLCGRLLILWRSRGKTICRCSSCM